MPVTFVDQSPVSAKLKAFLAEVSREAGRLVFFLDLAALSRVDPSVSPLVKARVVSEAKKPYIAIAVNMAEMAASAYRPESHDPLIAHEANHALLWAKGLAAISKSNQPEELWSWIDTINNWLADPLINVDIHQRGFDMSKDRAREIRTSIKPLNRGTWAQKPFAGSFRVAVSLLLEPNIDQALRSQFISALRRGLGIAKYGAIDKVVKLIRSQDLASVGGFREAGWRVVDHLRASQDIQLVAPKHDEPLRKFSEDEIKAWKEQEIALSQPWP